MKYEKNETDRPVFHPAGVTVRPGDYLATHDDGTVESVSADEFATRAPKKERASRLLKRSAELTGEDSEETDGAS